MSALADTERFYTVLQAAQERSRTDAEIILPVAEQQVEAHREIVAELRRVLAGAESELERWASTAAELRAARDGVEPVKAALGGKALAEIAVTVLRESGKPQPIHYSDWLDLIRLAGYQVSGRDPQATLLTALGRDQRCESIGGRTGLWRLAE